jgi:hypothetical protein
MFDIPAARLADLDDSDLRGLVARLCEAERERQGGHRTEVSWGGAQTAPDGGLDVVVMAPDNHATSPVLPRARAGFQVKRATMSAASIAKEMRPDGDLRPSISRLASVDGAYLIVSGADDCSADMLERRERAMRDAVTCDRNAGRIALAFVDRGRLSRWLSAHPSVILWIRGRLALPSLQGWKPYGRWSATPHGVSDDLICDRGLRVWAGRAEPVTDLPAALDAIRDLVRQRTEAIRIAGPSGIGKTRIVQALFETGAGGEPLPASQAIYADAGSGSDPPASGMLDHLMAREIPAVLVIDNCPPDLHRNLAGRLSRGGGPVRLITVEYDLRDDHPDMTEVVRIEAEGPEIAARLVGRRHPGLSPFDTERLAELAGGNARLALALADSAPKTGSLSALGDADLFDRLFWPRGERDPELADAAGALSLVYSFNVEDESPGELGFLGALVELSRRRMYRAARVLLDRGLAQARGPWRAVLPHALANRLAREALRSMPAADVADAFAREGAKRLRQSLGRRLACLHDVPEARQVVERWMREDGPLGGAPDLDLLGRVCRLAPRQSLALLDRLIADTGRDAHVTTKIVRVAGALAHAPGNFTEACRLLRRLALSHGATQREDPERTLTGLFSLYLSGTMAPTETRETFVRECLTSDDAGVVRLGLSMFGNTVKTRHWSGFLVFDDARPDAYGWAPGREEAIAWYETFIGLATEIATGPAGPARDGVRGRLADALRGLWRLPELRDTLERATGRIHDNQPWVEGWLGFRQIVTYDTPQPDAADDVDLNRVGKLIAQLEPKDLASRIRVVLRSEGSEDLMLGGDGDGGDRDRLDRHLEELGRELAVRPDVRDELGRELMEGQGASLHALGLGLGRAVADRWGEWVMLRDLYLQDPRAATQTGILAGYVHALDAVEPTLADRIRGACLGEPDLRAIYATFVRADPMDEAGLRRALRAIGDPAVNVAQFDALVWAENYALSDPDRIRVLEALLAKPDGVGVVLRALSMLCHVERTAPREWPPALREIGLRAIVAVFRSDAPVASAIDDHTAARVVAACLIARDRDAATPVLDALVAHVRRHYGSIYRFSQTAAAIAARALHGLLDRIFGVGGLSQDERRRLFEICDDGDSVLDDVAPSDLVSWCEAGDAGRWSVLAASVDPFVSEETAKSLALSAQAVALLDAAPDPGEVIRALASRINPMSWSGSRARLVEQRIAAFASLRTHPDAGIRSAIEQVLREAEQTLDAARERERPDEMHRDQRFE